MTRIKICGITNEEDARAAIEFGADALGFIFVPDTPRFLGDPAAASVLLTTVPPIVTRVGVVRGAAEAADCPEGLEAVQFYGGSWDPTQARGRRGIQAFRIEDAASLDQIAASLGSSRPDAILLDTYHKAMLGGSGETFNWDLAREAKERFRLPLILAGGLTPDNVAEAIRQVRPFAVDVSSGVEATPGRKDHRRLQAFVRAVRAVQ